jgi:hypothetical protein
MAEGEEEPLTSIASQIPMTARGFSNAFFRALMLKSTVCLACCSLVTVKKAIESCIRLPSRRTEGVENEQTTNV